MTCVDELEPFHREIRLAYFCSKPFQNMLARIRLGWENQGVAEADLVVLTWRWVMGTDCVQCSEVLGLVALCFHRVMSTFGIQGVITGDLVGSWYLIWSVSGIQASQLGCAMNCGSAKVWLRLLAWMRMSS